MVPEWYSIGTDGTGGGFVFSSEFSWRERLDLDLDRLRIAGKERSLFELPDDTSFRTEEPAHDLRLVTSPASSEPLSALGIAGPQKMMKPQVASARHQSARVEKV